MRWYNDCMVWYSKRATMIEKRVVTYNNTHTHTRIQTNFSDGLKYRWWFMVAWTNLQQNWKNAREINDSLKICLSLSLSHSQLVKCCCFYNNVFSNRTEEKKNQTENVSLAILKSSSSFAVLFSISLVYYWVCAVEKKSIASSNIIPQAYTIPSTIQPKNFHRNWKKKKIEKRTAKQRK